jgi:hypothetical protein
MSLINSANINMNKLPEDIQQDIAVIGIRKADFFKVYGELLHETHRAIDLICPDIDTFHFTGTQVFSVK